MPSKNLKCISARVSPTVDFEVTKKARSENISRSEWIHRALFRAVEDDSVLLHISKMIGDITERQESMRSELKRLSNVFVNYDKRNKEEREMLVKMVTTIYSKID